MTLIIFYKKEVVKWQRRYFFFKNWVVEWQWGLRYYEKEETALEMQIESLDINIKEKIFLIFKEWK